jgi:hypothetical protein
MVLGPRVRTEAVQLSGDAIEMDDTVLSNSTEPTAGPTVEADQPQLVKSA